MYLLDFSVRIPLAMNLVGSQLLKSILNEVKNQQMTGQKCLLVFDLDSTLFDVSPRLEQIIQDFAELPETIAKFPESVAILKNIKMLRSDWGIKNALFRAGLDKQHPEFEIAIKTYWRDHFFSNHYLEFDRPYEGAVDYVNELAKTGAEIVYLTGRDVARMAVGSEKVLLKWGFPLDGTQSRLVLKPMKGMDDAEFKSDWFGDLPDGKYTKIWLFENEPVNVNLVRKCHQHVEIVFFESTHSGQAEAPEDLPRIFHYLIQD